MPPTNTDVVTAVIVAHDGAAWVPHVAQALREQTRPVQRVVGVDTGSQDRSGAMLADLLGRGNVFGMDRRTGYAAAVQQALRHRAAHTHIPASGAPGERIEWVWLLHDDCEPEPDALERLLLGAAQTPGVAVFGPKLMDFSDRDVVLEVGVTVDRAGRRITGIEPREVDQGQHDGDRDVLAVSSAGMLVRRDVWEQVGGFDPGMRLFREDMDFCWRVHAAGYRVRVITDAVVYHVEASARNRRPASAVSSRGRQDRRNALRVLLGNLPARPMLAALAGNLTLSALRTLIFFLAKRPAAALDELGAVSSVIGHPLQLLALRRNRARGRRAAFSRLRADLPPGNSVRRLAEFVSGALSRSVPADMVGSHHATQDPADDDSLLVDSGLLQRLLTHPGVLLVLGLVVITGVAVRPLLGGTPLGGGDLVPAWGGASALWHEYVQSFHPAGLGTATATPPYVVLVAGLAMILGGKPWLAVDVILLGCVPLAGITAFLAMRRVVRFTPVRVWAAATYALLPVGLGAVAAGRLGAAAVLTLLPLAGVLAARIFTESRRRARRAAWATGLVVALAAAFVPLIWLISAVVVALAAVAFGRRRLAAALDAAIVAVVPVVLLLPWIGDVFAHPAHLFLEAGLHRPGLASAGLSAKSLLLLSPGGPGLPPVWVGAGLLVTAVVVLLTSGHRLLVLAGWGVAIAGFATAAGVSRVSVTPVAGGGPVHAWPGIALAVAAGGLLLAVAAAGNGLPGLLRSGGWHSPRGLAVLLVAVVACSAPVLTAAFWVMTGVRGPVAPVTGPVLPEFVTVSSSTGLRLRTLVLHGTPRGVSYSVLRNTDPLFGSPALTTPPAAEHALQVAVAALAAPHGNEVQNQGQVLAGFGIGYVLMPAPVDTALARLVDGSPGLQPVSKTSGFQLWQVVDPTARVTVREPDGAVVPVQSGPVNVADAKAPAAGGTLVLAEPAGGWDATLNGHPLKPLAAPVDGWAQGFRLPAGGGSLSIHRTGISRDAEVALEGVAAVLVAVLGLPGARVAGEDEDEDVRGKARGRPRARARRRRLLGGGGPVLEAAAGSAVSAAAVTRTAGAAHATSAAKPVRRPETAAAGGISAGRGGGVSPATGPPSGRGTGREDDPRRGGDGSGREGRRSPGHAGAGRHGHSPAPDQPSPRDPATNPGVPAGYRGARAPERGQRPGRAMFRGRAGAGGREPAGPAPGTGPGSAGPGPRPGPGSRPGPGTRSGSGPGYAGSGSRPGSSPGYAGPRPGPGSGPRPGPGPGYADRELPGRAHAIPGRGDHDPAGPEGRRPRGVPPASGGTDARQDRERPERAAPGRTGRARWRGRSGPTVSADETLNRGEEDGPGYGVRANRPAGPDRPGRRARKAPPGSAAGGDETLPPRASPHAYRSPAEYRGDSGGPPDASPGPRRERGRPDRGRPDR